MKVRVFDPQGSQIGWYEFDGDKIDDKSLRYRPARFDIYAPYQWSFTSHQMVVEAEFLIDTTPSLPHDDSQFTELSVRSVGVTKQNGN
jgi:hypothetical protein